MSARPGTGRAAAQSAVWLLRQSQNRQLMRGGRA